MLKLIKYKSFNELKVVINVNNINITIKKKKIK